MKILHSILFCLVFTSTIQAQQLVANDSPILGRWNLVSPQKKPGPEFIPESYKGINSFLIQSGQKESIAEGTGKGYYHSIIFIAEWDEMRLTGTVKVTTWSEDISKLKISVPFQYDAKKDQIVIHIDNPEYGNVSFIYKKMK